MADVKKPADKKPAPKAKNGPGSYSVPSLYESKGDNLVRKNKSCPKCGHGYFLAKHKDRLVCGKCNYVEMVKSH